MLQYDVVIIGAGASGLFCGFQTALFGKRVLILDHANKVGKKILMSGGGRCNFINTHVEPRHFISQNPHFVKSALSRYGSEDFLNLVKKHKIAYHEKEQGQLFCDHSSKDILNMLLAECQTAGVEIRTHTNTDSILATDTGFLLSTSHKTNQTQQNIQTKFLVIATGGLSIPTLGASGFGYQVARQFGHSIIPTSASLVPFTLTDKIGQMAKQLSGISIEVTAFNDQISFNLPMLFTHRGLSGPAILQLSNYWEIGQSIYINLLPTIQADQLLILAKKHQPKQLIRTVLAPHLPKKLLASLEEYFWEKDKNTELANLKDDRLTQIGQTLNAWQIKPSGTEGYRVAEVTKGGVNTDEISGKTMQSRLQDNLYFIGEVLDVTGHLGGYNFAWAWASAYACAESIGSQW